MRIDDRLGDVEAAARVAHLRVHVREPVSLTLPCDAFVQATMRSEAVAMAVEMAERKRLGLRPEDAVVTLPFAHDATADDVLSWLHTHPDGGPGVRAVAADARALCLSRSSQ